MAVHAGGTFRFTRAAVPHFRRQNRGRIINVTSYTGVLHHRCRPAGRRRTLSVTPPRRSTT
ncbi:hypothetical protein ACQP2Y_16340 [Actinoplanes sp. CA-051413]|uniref:hypothetical protein n=1 Tax=Actinoplanes sp. CA-051413 TaxID=3239899 RepID=UPI003D977EF3